MPLFGELAATAGVAVSAKMSATGAINVALLLVSFTFRTPSLW